MSPIQPNLTTQEIQLLKELELDPNSANLTTEIEDILDQNPVKYTNYDTGGISKAVNWQGGGDFIYLELAKWNEKYVELVRDCETSEKLWFIWLEMQEKAFLDYRIETINLTNRDFQALTLDEQKNLLVGLLDKNQLYINHSEIQDKSYAISDEDKELNKLFYKK